MTRPLLPTVTAQQYERDRAREVIHHIDGNPLNNAPGNLVIMDAADNGTPPPIDPAEQDRRLARVLRQRIASMRARLRNIEGK